MIERISLIAIAIFIGACASSGPEAPAPAAAAPATNGDAVAATTEAAPAEGEIYDLDAPDAEQSEAMAQNEGSEMVCRREVITGTKMSRKVCRHRADIEAREARGQEALRGMRKSGSQMERESTISN